jgi:hypothetical protein
MRPTKYGRDVRVDSLLNEFEDIIADILGRLARNANVSWDGRFMYAR